MQRFSRRNAFGWVGGAAALIVTLGLKVGIFNRFVFAFICVAALVALAYWVFRVMEQSRHARRLREFALTHGWTYHEQGGAVVAGLTGFPFGEGRDRMVEDLVEGTYGGHPCASYTYRFEQRVAGERTAEQLFTVTQVSLDVPYQRLDLVPEDIGSRLLNAVGFADIDLESAEFNRTWRVQCADKRYAVDFLDPRMMQLLLTNRMQGVAVRVDGNRVFAWSAGVANVKDLSRRLDLVCGVAGRIPAHVARAATEAEQQRRALADEQERNAPAWAKTGGVLNSGHYTGIGVDADGDGVDDWNERNR